MKHYPTIAIVGRPNVGKSSIFNRIVGRRAAVVSDREGVTRDRHYQVATWNQVPFNLVDTGGFITDDSIDEMADSVRIQIIHAVTTAELVIFVVDGRVGVTKQDQIFADIIHKNQKQVLLVCNKNEELEDRQEVQTFYKLGFGEPYSISALTGYAFNSFLSKAIELVPKKTIKESEEQVTKIAILGRPNAGKSTLLNRLLREERMITSDVAGTTRDSIDCQLKIDGKNYLITDTAGLRKKARVSEEVEYFSNMRSLQSIKRSDVVVLMFDVNRGLGIQDYRIIDQIKHSAKGIILVINKWDLYEKESNTLDTFKKELYHRDASLKYLPIIAMSALEGLRIGKLMETIDQVYENCFKVLGRDALIKEFESAVRDNPHPARVSKIITMTRVCQIMVNPPVVTIESNHPDLIDESWKRYFLRRLHKKFNMIGAPLRLNFDLDLDLRTDEDLGNYR
ncbi:MAG: ribosome biogenesis GTPase Der [Fibrobacterales bacterium]